MKRIIFIVALFLTNPLVLAGSDSVSSSTSSSPKIALATTEWPPYVSKQLPDNGYLYQIIQQALHSKGYQTNIQFMSWPQAKQFGQTPRSGFFPAYQDDITNTPATCSMPFDGGPIGLFRNKAFPIEFPVANPAKNQATTFKKLSKYTFGVVKGYTNTTAFDNATDLRKIEAKDDFKNLIQLQDGIVDLAIMDVFVAMYLIDKHPTLLNEIEFMGPALEYKKLYLCVGNDNSDQYPIILTDFNAALIKMKASGKLDKIIKKYGL